MTELESELDAMRTVADALSNLDEDARSRVMQWVAAQFQLKVPDAKSPDGEHADSYKEVKDLSEFGVFADFFDQTSPSTQAEKALVAGYWLQFGQGLTDFTGRQVNDLLRDVGHELSNVTVSFRSLEQRKPTLARQASKGKGKMGHKTYRLTAAGEKAVKKMLRPPSAEEPDEN